LIQNGKAKNVDKKGKKINLKKNNIYIHIFLKFIFDISTSKQFKNIKKN